MKKIFALMLAVIMVISMFAGCGTATDPVETTDPVDTTTAVEGDTTPDETDAQLEATKHEHNYTTTVVDPTCTAEGYTIYTCEDCGDTYRDNLVTMLYHDYETKTVAATATERGYDLHTCKLCGESYKDNYTEKLSDGSSETHKHSYKSETTKAATCTSKGVKTFTCSCGETYTEDIPATGHSYTAKTTKSATCTSKGVKTYTCKNCNDSYTEDIPKTAHSYVTTTVAPTTEAQGYDLHKCSACGTSYKDNYTDKLSAETKPHTHNYTSKVTAPTCTSKGYTTYTCSGCGDSYTGNETAATGHSYSSKVTKEATCTADGVKTYTCKNCNDSYTEAITKTAHSYKTETVAPTTDSEGYDLHTCTVCGDKYKDNYTDKLPSNTCTNHEYEWVCDPNYNSDTVGTCKNCGAQKVLYASQSVISSEALAILNAYREAEGLEPVVAWTKGEKVAKVRAAELTVCASHNRPDGSYGYGTCVAGGYSSAQAVIDAWMASSSHRGSLMDPNATKAVIAYNGSCWVLWISS